MRACTAEVEVPQVAPFAVLDVQQYDNAGDDDAVDEQPDKSDRVVRVALVRRGIFRERWEHAEQDREHRDGEPDHDSARCSLLPPIGNRPQRPEEGRAENEGEEEPQPGVGKVLTLSPVCAAGLEVADLPQQRTGDGQLDRDDGLEVLNRHVHGGMSMSEPVAERSARNRRPRRK
jgi:hypothetical protein